MNSDISYSRDFSKESLPPLVERFLPANLQEEIAVQMEKNPLRTLALALGAGFLIAKVIPRSLLVRAPFFALALINKDIEPPVHIH